MAHAPKKTLGDCLKDLRTQTDDPGRRLLDCIEKAWNFSNAAPSTRHGGGLGDPITVAEAQFTVGVAEHGLRLLLTYDRS